MDYGTTWAHRVGAGQHVARHRGAKAHMVQPWSLRRQAGLDVAQEFSKGQLREGHRVELIQTREALDLVLAVVARHATPKRRQRQVRDELREIVTMLDAINRKIDLHRRKHSVLEELFKAMLHKLMAGEIRIDALDRSALQEHGGGSPYCGDGGMMHTSSALGSKPFQHDPGSAEPRGFSCSRFGGRPR